MFALREFDIAFTGPAATETLIKPNILTTSLPYWRVTAGNTGNGELIKFIITNFVIVRLASVSAKFKVVMEGGFLLSVLIWESYNIRKTNKQS